MTHRMPVLFMIVTCLVGLACSKTGIPVETGPTSVSTAPSPTPAAPSAPPDTTCQRLQVAQKPGESGASGLIAIVIEVTNTSDRTCVLNGYPSFELLSGMGTLPMGTVQHGGSGPAPLNASPTPVTLPVGDKAGFLLMYRNRTSSGGGCPSAIQMRLTSPGPFTGTVDILVCGDQPMNVSPYVIAARLPSF